MSLFGSPIANLISFFSDGKGLSMQNILIAARGIFRSLIYLLDIAVYKLIIYFYNVFRWMCGARIIDNNVMSELATRIGFILGLIMFFYISFDFIQILIDPDKINDKDKGPLNIIKKFLIVIILLGTSKYIFDLMFNLQSVLLSGDDKKGSVIERLLLPYDIDTANFGAAISAQFMANFYQITDDQDTTALGNYVDDYDYDMCYNFAETLPVEIANDSNFEIGWNCLNAKYVSDTGWKFFIDFDHIFSLVVGIFVLWSLLMYCISVGVRVIQLAVLEIISPAAIICYLSPSKENTFTKWLKLYIATYIDVFIRIAIIDFGILMCGLVLDAGMSDSFWTSSISVPEAKEKFIITVLMIVAILNFAKKAPDLVKRLLPEGIGDSGIGFGISAKDNFGLGVLTGAAGTAFGMVAGGGVNAVVGAVDRSIMAKKLGKNAFLAGTSGALGGFARGIGQGVRNKGNFMKNIPAGFKAQHEADVKYEDLIASGGSARGVLGSKLSEFAGETEGQRETRILNNMNRMAEYRQKAWDDVDEISFVKSAKEAWTHSTGSEAERAVLYNNYVSKRNAARKYVSGDSDALKSVDAEVEITKDNYEQYLDVDESGNQLNSIQGMDLDQFFDIDGSSYGRKINTKVDYTDEILNDDTNSVKVRSAQAQIAAASRDSVSHNVEYYKAGAKRGDSTVRLGTAPSDSKGTYEWFNSLGNLASDNEIAITNFEGRAARMANDAAAGVKDRSGKK